MSVKWWTNANDVSMQHNYVNMPLIYFVNKAGQNMPLYHGKKLPTSWIQPRASGKKNAKARLNCSPA